MELPADRPADSHLCTHLPPAKRLNPDSSRILHYPCQNSLPHSFIYSAVFYGECTMYQAQGGAPWDTAGSKAWTLPSRGSQPSHGDKMKTEEFQGSMIWSEKQEAGGHGDLEGTFGLRRQAQAKQPALLLSTALIAFSVGQ